jgi:hypothetical protein
MRDSFIQGLHFAQKQQDTSKTPAGYAGVVMEKLQELDAFKRFEPQEGLRSFLSHDEQIEAARSLVGPDGQPQHERYLVAFLTPFFQDRLMSHLPEHLVLVNSEQYAWLPQGARDRRTYTAPDQFVAPHYLVNYRRVYKDAPAIEGGQYGAFPVIASKVSIQALFDGKVKLDSTGTGDFFKYLVALSTSPNPVDVTHARGMVFDASHARLVTAVCGHVISVTDVRWTDAGSHRLIVDFFAERRDVAHEAAELARNGLQVNFERFTTQQVVGDESLCCVLGEGAFGRVYRANRIADGAVVALKVVHGAEACTGLRQEYQVFDFLPAEAFPYVVRVEANSFWQSTIPRGGSQIPVAAFLGSAVGKPFQHMDEIGLQQGIGILFALGGLHAAGVVHGDARWRNVVAITQAHTTTYKWVDLRYRGVRTAVGFAEDLNCFFASVSTIAAAPHGDVIRDYADHVTEWTAAQRAAAATGMFRLLPAPWGG